MPGASFAQLLTRARTSKLNPSWHRNYVGGLWDEVGDLQFEFLVSQGLQPEHYLLDVGCGALRGGIRFVRYLDEGHYFGIDIMQDLLNAGEAELRKLDLLDKRPTLKRVDGFEFGALGRQFDFALAQSVFTHLPLNDIERCLVNMGRALVTGGKFYATFFENPAGKRNLSPIDHGRVVTHFDRDPFHYDYATFEWLCQGTGLHPRYIGDWNHPRNQRMLLFTKTE